MRDVLNLRFNFKNLPRLGVISLILFTCGCGIAWVSFPYSQNAKSKITAIYTGGNFANYNSTTEPDIARINFDGSLNSSFNPTGSGLNNLVDAIAIDSSGKILVGGFFTTYNGASEPSIARLNTDGSLDTTFNPVGSGFDGPVIAILIDSSGKILVAGWFSHYNGALAPHVARLNTDGSIDGTFAQTGTGLSASALAIAFDSSNRIIVGGQFATYNGISEPNIVRLNSNGTLDGTFGPTGTGLNGTVVGLAIDTSGKIVVGGLMTSYNGTGAGKIARLNSDGSLDFSFVTGAGFSNNVQTIVIDSGGKILVGGFFGNFNGSSAPGIARLNTDGSIDATFGPVGTGLNGTVNAIAIDSSGKILVGGTFTSYNGTSMPYLARLNSDGSLDTSFNAVGTGLSNSVSAVGL